MGHDPGKRTHSRDTNWCFIVGAPRCGTTSLARYLQAHPDVCFSTLKEPHFFSRRDLRALPQDQLIDVVDQEYLERFFPYRSAGSLMAEGSVSYLYAAERMEPILKLWPNAKFVIALRNPLEMLPSLHQRQIYNGDETVRDFERAWSLIPERRENRRVPRTCADPRLLDYEEIGRLGAHVRRFLEVVGRERCLILLYDDFALDPASHYRRVLDFVGLQDDGRTAFDSCRTSVAIRIGWLQRLLKRPPKAMWSALASDQFRRREGHPASRDESRPPAALMGIRKRILQWNKMPARPARMSERLRSSICDALRDDVAQLSELTGRNLTHWLEPQEPSCPETPHHPRQTNSTGLVERLVPEKRLA
jgi:hypothetical protein